MHFLAHIEKSSEVSQETTIYQADEEIRTLDPHPGKEMLYH